MQQSISLAEYQQRRQRILDHVSSHAEHGVAVIAAASLQTRSRDTEYPFRQNSDFFYLTGFNEPDALLILAPGRAQQVILCCQPSDPAAEVWHGRRLGIDRAVAHLGVDVAHSIEDAEEVLLDVLNQADVVFSSHEDSSLLEQLHDVASALRQAPKQGYVAPSSWQDLSPFMADMRIIKSAAELDLMRAAAAISVAGHKRAMRFTKPGCYEFQVAAELHHEFARQGAHHPAYGSICGGGDNACILHYTDNADELHDGDLILIDAGAEYQGYAGDITRTFPVNGRFSEVQAALYNVVLKAQLAALAAVTPGSSMPQATQAMALALTEGLVELGLLAGTPAQLVAEGAYKAFMIHGLGHWLGLDVHDVGTYSAAGKNRPFEPGMVLTIEPGVYIPHGMAGVDKKWHGLGIRIEDDVIVTATGHENMTAAAPKTVAEIETWMQG